MDTLHYWGLRFCTICSPSQHCDRALYLNSCLPYFFVRLSRRFNRCHDEFRYLSLRLSERQPNKQIHSFLSWQYLADIRGLFPYQYSEVTPSRGPRWHNTLVYLNITLIKIFGMDLCSVLHAFSSVITVYFPLELSLLQELTLAFLCVFKLLVLLIWTPLPLLQNDTNRKHYIRSNRPTVSLVDACDVKPQPVDSWV